MDIRVPSQTNPYILWYFRASACCSACDVTIASLDPLASQADFAAVQLKLFDETW